MTFDICKVGLSAECTTLFVEDKSVYTSPARNEYALFLAGFFYMEDEEDIRINIDNTLPESVVTWEVPSTSDGYHYFDLIPVLIWNVAGTTPYLVGDVRYWNTFYWKCTVANTGDIPGVSSWVEVEDPYLEKDSLNSALAASIADVTRVDEFSFCRADICYKRIVHDAAKAGCADCATFVSKNLMRVDSLLQDAYMAVAQTRYTEAHKIALLLQDICNDLTDCGCS